MNAPEPATFGAALGLVLFALPFLVLALRRARRVVPFRPRTGFRWRSGEAAAVIATPFVLAVVLGALVGRRPGVSDNPLFSILASQLLLGGAVALALFFAARRPAGLASLGLTPPPSVFGSIVLVYAPGYLAGSGILLLWTRVCQAFDWEQQQEVLRLILGLESNALLVAAVVAGLLGPLIEELLFRGFLQTFLEGLFGERTALLATSALFAVLHGMAGLPALFLLSLFLGWLQQRTRSILVPWSVHALNNTVMLTLAFTLRNPLDP